jgi:hypothetical protein
MRRLKSFKLFESLEEDKNEILSNCEDFLKELDLISSTFEWKCNFKSSLFNINSEKTLVIEIWKKSNRGKINFGLSDISDVVDSIKDYMHHWGYIISYQSPIPEYKSFRSTGTICQWEIRFKKELV